MKYSITFLERIFDDVIAHLSASASEQAGFLFATCSKSQNELRFIAREFWPVREEHVLSRGFDHISLTSKSYCPALQHADETNQSFWFVHSHPNGYASFSQRDDIEEPGLFRTAYNRVSGDLKHGSLVFPREGQPFGRVWLDERHSTQLSRIRVIGQRFRFSEFAGDTEPIPEFFDRQVRAFGSDVQRVLRSLHVAVVGCGGTGSAVCEQLIRLGVGTLSVYDYQAFELSNVNRVYGSSARDNGVPKVELIERLASNVELGTSLRVHHASIYREDVALTLREADVVFGCTDDDLGRSILNQLALRYAIPVFDMGVRIDSQQQVIRSIWGRVTTLYPGAGCLLCRRRITPERIADDGRRFFTPEEADTLRREGYAPELNENDPAVIPFTTAVAAASIAELLHRLTGFMGPNRATTEVLMSFDGNENGKNSSSPHLDCCCAQQSVLGSGDTRNFLGMQWP